MEIFPTFKFIAIVLLIAANWFIVTQGKTPSCSKPKRGKRQLYPKVNGEDGILVCLKYNRKYQWKFLDGSPTLGEKIDPAKDCADILDNLPDAKDGFYWIALRKGKVKKVWCDVHVDGGGFMLIGMKDSPVSWNVPSNSTPVDPKGPPHWSSEFGNFQVQDFAVQVSTNSSFAGTQAYWMYRLNERRRLGKLFGVKKVCTDLHSGIGDVAYVKDLLTATVVNRKFDCSKFGPHVNHGLGWARMNYCLENKCPTGYAFIPGVPFRLDSFGSFSYSATSSFSGMTHNATAFVGCDNHKCCACYGPKGGRRNYCRPACESMNGGTVKKQAYVWFWIRTRMPKRLWKRCMEFKMKMGGNVETYFIDRMTGYAQKGSCSKQFYAFLNEGTLSVTNKNNLKSIPPVSGLLSYRKDNNKLYVNNGSEWNALGSEKEIDHLDTKVDVWINKIKRLDKEFRERALYALHFSRQDTRDYVISRGNTPSMNAITACLWMKSNMKTGQPTWVSYATPKAQNSFLLFVPNNDLQILVMDKSSSTGVKTNDGKWHHICVIWTSSGGKYTVYKDGSVASQRTIGGTSGITILGGGTWILGQEQDKVGGGFQLIQGFVGEMTGVNIWDRRLSGEAIKRMSVSCQLSVSGNVKSWNTFRHMIQGNVEVVKPKLC